MSTSIFEAKANGMAIKNDALRDAFAIDGVRCFLLKRGENTKIFTNVGELTSGYRIKFDDDRSESGLFRHSTISLSFRDDWAEATHIGYGVPASSKIEVFEMVEDEKDSIDPDASSVYWSARITKVENERYTIT